MCGIAGILAKSPVPTETVRAMLDAIAYRGPDATHVAQYQSDNGAHLTVGQVRLAILDPRPEADQPFDNEGRTASLTFNGEFYNFRRIRQELENQGESFRTESDTEVALRLLDKEGPKALNRLWGMFAGAYFDGSSGRLLLFRDRLGKKPLYLYPTADRLYFASEPKAILAALDHRPEPDNEALLHYFYLGYLPPEYTAFKNLTKLPAGCCLTAGADLNPQVERWYQPETEPSHEEQDLEALFMDAVAIRMISDRPLGAFLSGGLDSSLVVAAMSQLSEVPVNTFSVRFEGPSVLDESPYARAVSRHCGTNHHEIALDPKRLRDIVPEVLDHFDEPFGDSSAVPTYLISKVAREHFTVALTGDGADEVFGGYRKYLGEHYIGKLGPYPLRHWLMRPLVSMLPTGRTNRLLETARRMRRLLQGDAPTAAERHINWLQMSPVAGDKLLGSAYTNEMYRKMKAGLLNRLPAVTDLNDRLRFDQELVLREDMFVKIDRMSMKASLELRSPLVDHRLVNLANRLPADRKIAGTTRKRVLLERLGHLLPPEILARPKSGFEMPLGAWLRTDLAVWAEDRLFHHADTAAWVNRDALKDLWRTHLEGRRDYTETLWYHIVFASWIRKFGA